MDHKIRIASAGNVMPGALACLQKLGFVVSIDKESDLQNPFRRDSLMAQARRAALGHDGRNCGRRD